MVILYLPPPTWPHRDTAMPRTPRVLSSPVTDVPPYARATAPGWVGGKRVASVERSRAFDNASDTGRDGTTPLPKRAVFVAALRTPIS